MDNLYAWVKSIAVFLLLSTLLDQLMASSSYKKYIKVAVGMVMILLMVTPLLGLLDMDQSLEYYFKMENYKIQAADLDFDADLASEQYSRLMTAQYRETLKEQMVTLLEDDRYTVGEVYIEIDEDYDSDNYGRVFSIHLSISSRQTDEQERSIKVEDIKIDQDRQDAVREDQALSNEKDGISREIRDTLASYYGVNADNITIAFE